MRISLEANPNRLPEEARNCLRLLTRKDHVALKRQDKLLIVGKINGVSVRAGSASLAIGQVLEQAGLVAWHMIGAGTELRITKAGHVLAGQAAAEIEMILSHAGRGDPPAGKLAEKNARSRPIFVNTSESPLAWLRARRDKNGHPLIDSAAFEAGERFREELALSGMLPRVTADWSATIRGSGWRGGLLPSEALTAAKQRVHKAMDAIGPECSGLLIDLCGFLKGLELIEQERRWPPRSGKVAVQLALALLARHYGYAPAASGPKRSLGIKRWRHGDNVVALSERRPEGT